jgi:RNA polymerase sigma factor (sigma-70 family)
MDPGSKNLPAASRAVSAEDLARLAAGGNTDAWGILVRDYRDVVFQFLLEKTGKHADADDCTQQTFETARRCLPADGFDRSFQHWLIRVATNVYYKHRGRWRPTEEVSPMLLDEAPLPSEQVEARDELAYVISRAREKLSERDFMAFYLRFVEQLPAVAVARATGLGPKHVDVVVYRARQLIYRLRNS